MKRTVAVLATLDTKGEEAEFLREEIGSHDCEALLIDIGVVGAPTTRPDITREKVAEAGGTVLTELLREPTRQKVAPVLVEGATRLILDRITEGSVHALIGLGGTQGTSSCTAVMQALPYGFPKVMLSTLAAGDCSSFVGIRDVTMMFSVSDLLGLNPLTRKLLSNAAGAACGMAASRVTLRTEHGERPVIGISNLGVLTQGAIHAADLFRARGYEVIVFHAVGSGGRAMEQMMKDGLIDAVFDYAMGEISDEIFHGLRAGTPERLTVAGKLGLPQVLCPGGSEHIGLVVPANTVPERWEDHLYVFHSPIILAPRLSPEEFAEVARDVGRRLSEAGGSATLMFPARGTSRYAVPGGPLHDPEGDAFFLEELRRSLPENVQLIVRDAGAEDPEFVEEAVDRLVLQLEGQEKGLPGGAGKTQP